MIINLCLIHVYIMCICFLIGIMCIKNREKGYQLIIK